MTTLRYDRSTVAGRRHGYAQIGGLLNKISGYRYSKEGIARLLFNVRAISREGDIIIERIARVAKVLGIPMPDVRDPDVFWEEVADSDSF